MADFAERLCELMLEKNIKSSELASCIGVNTCSVNDWRRGKSNMFLTNALKLADFFGCSLDFLTGRSNTVIDYSPVPCPNFYSHFLAVLKKCGVSTYQMVTKGPIKGAHFYKWKRGADPLVPTLVVVADFLDVSLDYLVGRDH